MTASELDRVFVSQYTSGFPFTLVVHRQGVQADADGNLVTATLFWDDEAWIVFNRPADHPATGQYTVTISSGDAAAVGNYRIRFDYAIDAVPQVYEIPIEVGVTGPAYDALDESFKAVIENVYVLFADLYDSPLGGPHLQTYVQSKFGRNRMAQLLRAAVGRLNIAAQPFTTYSLDLATNPFPFQEWGALLEKALYLETMRHLQRSYVEDPDVVSAVAISRLDRRDYMARWTAIIEQETAEFADALAIFKMSLMGLGRPRVLVAGGAYGSIAPNIPYGVASRGRYYPRYF